MERLIPSLSELQINLLNEKSIHFICNVDINWSSQIDKDKNQIDSRLKFLTDTFPEFQFYSKSHCPTAGGIVISQQPCGIDIELTPRLEDRLIQRVSNDSEIEQSPNIKRLWSAKEAAFKSLKNINQPKVISEIHCHSWKKLSNLPFFEFSASIKNKNTGIGYSYISSEISFSLFFL